MFAVDLLGYFMCHSFNTHILTCSVVCLYMIEFKMHTNHIQVHAGNFNWVDGYLGEPRSSDLGTEQIMFLI